MHIRYAFNVFIQFMKGLLLNCYILYSVLFSIITIQYYRILYMQLSYFIHFYKFTINYEYCIPFCLPCFLTDMP